MSEVTFENELSQHVWESKYRYRPPQGSTERSISHTWERVAAALAAIEAGEEARWRRIYLEILEGFRFLPAGRILAGAGTAYRSTLFNCFVMGFIEDSLEGIFEQLRQSAVTMQWGGGIGCDFSTLRPRGAESATRGTTASGPVSFMRIWDAMCATLLSTGARRGAMMATLRCDHPDIEHFVDAKRERGALTNFNLSVQVTDEFMNAVVDGRDWPLCFPAEDGAFDGPVKHIRWPGRDEPVPCRVWRKVAARDLWRRIMDAAYETAEPGVLFVDRINRANNLYYCEHITSTNPCGEIPLPPYGACDLGSINLTAFVRQPFSSQAELDLAAVADVAAKATRLLDAVIDVSKYPLPAQVERVRATRRIGLGITGLADALIMLGLEYDSDRGRACAASVLATVRDAAYSTSTELAVEKGVFGDFERDAYLEGEYIRSLPDDISDAIARNGIRNSHLIAIAPTGTISLLANNVSSGIEPVFAPEAERRVLDRHGAFEVHRTIDHALAVWRRTNGGKLPPGFVTAQELSPQAHLKMQAALQPLVDNSISKTINVPADLPREAFASIYLDAHRLGLKGCTVFRPNDVTGAILSDPQAAGRVHCCAPEREGD